MIKKILALSVISFLGLASLSGMRDNLEFCELEGHAATINSVTTARVGDGNWIISASDDGTIKAWDFSSEVCQRTYHGHTAAVRCVKHFHSNDSINCLYRSLIISGSNDCTVRLWDTASEISVARLHEHKGFVKVVEPLINPFFASGSVDRTIKIWDITKEHSVFTLSGHSKAINCLCLLDDDHFASGSNDKTIKIWNFRIGQCVRTIEGHEARILALLRLDDERLVATDDDDPGMCKIWNWKTGECLDTFDDDNAHGSCGIAHYGPNKIVLAKNNGIVWVYDYIEQKIEWIKNAGPACWPLSVATIGDSIICGGDERNSVFVWRQSATTIF